jgi:hypothetical protein
LVRVKGKIVRLEQGGDIALRLSLMQSLSKISSSHKEIKYGFSVTFLIIEFAFSYLLLSYKAEEVRKNFLNS